MRSPELRRKLAAIIGKAVLPCRDFSRPLRKAKLTSERPDASNASSLATGDVCLVGVEGSGSYGAGLARYLAASGVRVVKAGRAERQGRRRKGKADPLDAVSAPVPRSPGGHRVNRRAATGRWRQSGR